MNYEEVLKESQKKLENIRIRKAKVKEQIHNLAEQLNLDMEKPLAPQLEELEKSYKEKKEQLDKDLKELETKFKELESGVSQDKGESAEAAAGPQE